MKEARPLWISSFCGLNHSSKDISEGISVYNKDPLVFRLKGPVFGRAEGTRRVSVCVDGWGVPLPGMEMLPRRRKHHAHLPLCTPSAVPNPSTVHWLSCAMRPTCQVKTPLKSPLLRCTCHSSGGFKGLPGALPRPWGLLCAPRMTANMEAWWGSI